MSLRVTILLLCGMGLYASAFMTLEAARAARGELAEPSVGDVSKKGTAQTRLPFLTMHVHRIGTAPNS